MMTLFSSRGVAAAVVCAHLLGCGNGAGITVSALDAPSGGRGLQSADPALAVLPGSGDLVLTWIEGDGKTWTLFTARSHEAGDQWSPPVAVAGGAGAPGEVHPHGESSPRLVTAPNERVALVWPNSVTVPGRKWPAAMLRFAGSTDGGATWSRPITLNDDTTGAPVSHQFHGAAWAGDSGLVVAWLDERDVTAPIAAGTDGHAEHASEPDATIYLTASQDFGRTWTPNRIGWKAACPCCRVSLARDSAGRAVAAWRKHFPGNVRDVVTTVVTEAPSEPRRVHRDDWAYPGCPHTGPAIAIGTDGATHTVWYNGKPGDAGIYYARSDGDSGSAARVGLVSGPKVGTAHAAVAPLRDGGALAAYDVTADGARRITVARISPSGEVAGQVSIADSDDAKYPQLAVLGDSTAVVAWTSAGDDNPRVRLARLTLR